MLYHGKMFLTKEKLQELFDIKDENIQIVTVESDLLNNQFEFLFVCDKQIEGKTFNDASGNIRAIGSK